MEKIIIFAIFTVAAYCADKLNCRKNKTWEKYTDGSCEDLQEKTFAILDTLTPKERVEVFGKPPGVPLFIRMMTPEGFDAIWLSNAEDDDKHKKISEFAKKNFKGDQLSNFNSWFDEVRRHKAAVDERISKLSKKAKNALKKIIKIRAQEQDVIAKMSPAVARELDGLI